MRALSRNKVIFILLQVLTSQRKKKDSSAADRMPLEDIQNKLKYKNC